VRINYETAEQYEKRASAWHPWFAWRPVPASNKIVWLETVERRKGFIHFEGTSVLNYYRLVGEEGPGTQDGGFSVFVAMMVLAMMVLGAAAVAAPLLFILAEVVR